MLDEHLSYVADAVRLDRYRTAISKVLTSKDSIADLGCGSGILGLLCLQAGSRFVYAVDDRAIIEVARETLTRANYNKQVRFIRGRSTQIDLPERVDAIICDHVGYFGFDYGVVDFLADAKRRFLKPGGTLIPARIRLKTAAISSRKCSELAHGWRAENIPPPFHWLSGYSINSRHAVSLAPDDVLGPPSMLGEIDLHADNPEFFSWQAEMRIERGGIVHGVGGWFECELAPGVWMTNSPLAKRPINRPQAFLPIGEPVTARPGDLIRVTIMARPAENLIAWTVEFPATGQRFSHSTWQGMILTSENLVRANPQHIPQLSQEGRARMTVLGYCDGKRTTEEIEQAVMHDHPQLFPSRAEISRFVAKVLGRDTA